MTDTNETDELRVQQEPARETYHIKYIEQSGWGGQTRETYTVVECDHVEVTDGIVRFVEADGTDVRAISADRVTEYRKCHS